MKLTILHLSDIHIRETSDPILVRSQEIASACFMPARESNACFIVVTGDIAFSGQSSQYDLAEVFLKSIKTSIENEGCSLVHILVVPGNHDCDLQSKNRARKALLEQVINDVSLATDENVIDLCTAPQIAFNKFQEKITTTRPIHVHKLWTEYEFKLQEKIVRFSAINAAWMSRVPEQPGQLIYPVELFQEWLNETSDLRLGLMHHPLNWYAQRSYHPLRQALRLHVDVILSGHEHFANSGEITETISGKSLFFEAAALQPHERQLTPAFSVLVFDLDTNTVEESRYDVSSSRVSPVGHSVSHNLYLGSTRKTIEHQLTSTFQEVLRDPGGNFTHPDKDKIELDDVFVYPDLKERSSDDENNAYGTADTILAADHHEKKLLFLGDDKAGKSILLLKAFGNYYKRGLSPLFLKAPEFMSSSDMELGKQIKKQAEAQYSDAISMMLASRENKIALVDDIDRFRGGAKALHRLIQYLERQFSAVILTADPSFEFTELVYKEAAEALKKYQGFEILRFGHRLRYQLIKKWCLHGPIRTAQELDKQINDIEILVNSVVGKNLVPSQPIYLLILLQSYQQQEQGSLQSSSFAHYYQYLITKSLKEVGLKPDQFDELFNYLSHLAWFFRSSTCREATFGQLRDFNRIFSERFVSVDLASRLDSLCQAKILSQRSDYYSFTYPYVYYFFVGKYLADNLHKPEIREIVVNWSASLYKRENANSIVFLTHHRNDHWVIEQVSSVIKDCFPDQSPMKFDGDVGAINGLIDSASQLLLSNSDVDRNQVETRKAHDKFEQLEDENEADQPSDHRYRGQIEFANKLNLLTRTAEILGQILKNYYGSLERPVKAELLGEVLDGPLRFLRAVLNQVTDDPEGFVKDIETILDDKYPSVPRERKQDIARKIGFRFLGLICTGTIARTANYVSAEKLQDDVSDIVRQNPTIAYRLIEAATHLIQPGRLRVNEVKNFAEEIKSNVFAFTILQSLAALHLHLFHTRDDEKQKLCQYLKIGMTSSRAIDVKTKSTKLTKR